MTSSEERIKSRDLELMGPIVGLFAIFTLFLVMWAQRDPPAPGWEDPAMQAARAKEWQDGGLRITIDGKEFGYTNACVWSQADDHENPGPIRDQKASIAALSSGAGKLRCP